MTIVLNGTTGITTPATDNISGNLTFSSTAQRITGDFSNATLTSRIYAQSSTTNGTTSFGVIPNGAGVSSAYNVFANSDPTNTSFAQLRVGTDTGDVRLTSGISGTGTYLPMNFYTGGSERVRIDTSGNVGVGVAPSAWASGNKFIDVNASASYGAFGSTDSMMLANAYWNGTNWIRKNANNAWRMVMEAASGAPSWTFQYAGNSTAGSTISWSEAMRLDFAGQLGVGFTPLATQGNLQVYKSISGGGPATSGTTDANQVFAVNAGSVQLSYGAYAAGQGWIQQRAGGNFAVNYDLVLQPNGGSLLVGTTSSSGLVTAARNSAGGYSSAFSARAIGTANSQLAGYMFMPTFGNSTDYTPRRAADIWGGFNAANWTTEFLAFGVGTGSGNDAGNLTTERMRITGDGSLLVGITSTLYANSKLSVYNTSAGIGGIAVGYSSTSGQYRAQYLLGSNGNYYFDNGTNAAYLSSAGAWTNSSDARLKNSIVDIQHGLSAVMNTKPRSYKMNNLEGNYIGFVAQELQTVIPEVVSGDPEKQLGVDYGSLVAVAFKAIQEQQAIITALTSRLTALEKA